jgi:hypothetical protein
MAIEAEQPLLALILPGFFLSLTLILPAAVVAMRRGGATVWRQVAACLVAPLQEGSGWPPSPGGQKSWGAGEWGPFS